MRLATKRWSGWPCSSWSILCMCQQSLLLCHIPCVINLLATVLRCNYQHECFCLLSNRCLCMCHSFTNIKGCLQNAMIALNPLWTPSSPGRVQIFALFSGRVFISGMMFSLLIFSTAVSDCQESHMQTWTFTFSFSSLLLCDCSSCLPCCSIQGPVGTAARYWQSCKNLSLLWTYIHYFLRSSTMEAQDDGHFSPALHGIEHLL